MILPISLEESDIFCIATTISSISLTLSATCPPASLDWLLACSLLWALFFALLEISAIVDASCSTELACSVDPCASDCDPFDTCIASFATWPALYIIWPRVLLKLPLIERIDFSMSLNAPTYILSSFVLTSKLPLAISSKILHSSLISSVSTCWLFLKASHIPPSSLRLLYVTGISSFPILKPLSATLTSFTGFVILWIICIAINITKSIATIAAIIIIVSAILLSFSCFAIILFCSSRRLADISWAVPIIAFNFGVQLPLIRLIASFWFPDLTALIIFGTSSYHSFMSAV